MAARVVLSSMPRPNGFSVGAVRGSRPSFVSPFWTLSYLSPPSPQPIPCRRGAIKHCTVPLLSKDPQTHHIHYLQVSNRPTANTDPSSFSSDPIYLLPSSRNKSDSQNQDHQDIIQNPSPPPQTTPEANSHRRRHPFHHHSCCIRLSLPEQDRQ